MKTRRENLLKFKKIFGTTLKGNVIGIREFRVCLKSLPHTRSVGGKNMNSPGQRPGFEKTPGITLKGLNNLVLCRPFRAIKTPADNSRGEAPGCNIKTPRHSVYGAGLQAYVNDIALKAKHLLHLFNCGMRFPLQGVRGRRGPLNKLLLRCISILIIIGLPHYSQAQIKPMLNKGTSRAVIIGISDYYNKNIPDLSYAHADARAFADFLKSPAGGNLPEDKIILLTNEMATHGRMAAALTWLLEESREGDKAIIYFSGHGDMETQTMMQHGFLLAYDAPATTYIAGGAFPVFYLQSIITTLSVQKQVQVFMVSDACRAGKLAGSEIGGTYATAKVLMGQFANEIKILSCQPDEFSLEGEQWGGGRGVFSYHLIDGLTGLADGNRDLSVNLLEIGRYLEDIIPLETAPQSQIPMTIGNKTNVVSRVDETMLAGLKAQKAGEHPALAAINTKGFEENVLANADSSLLPLYDKFLAAMENGHLLYPPEGSANALYKQLSKEESIKSLHGLMRRNLAAALQDEAQLAINDYLESPARELAKRWNYDQRYGQYPEYLARSAELLGKQHYMHASLKARQFYFEGLRLRLQGERYGKTDSLYQLGIEKQNQALQFEQNAAYAYNELGLLFRRLKNYEKAVGYFEKANEISPMWVLPMNNLGLTFYNLKRYEQAEKKFKRVIELQPGLSLPYYNLGKLYFFKTGDYDKAEYYLKKAIEYSPERVNAYFYLGQLYYQKLGKFTEAEAQFRKILQIDSKDADAYNELGLLYAAQDKIELSAKHYKLAIEVKVDYPFAYYNLGLLYLRHQRYAEADESFSNYLRLEPDDPDGYYNMACSSSLQNKATIALDWLEKALEIGWNDLESLQTDADLESVRNTSEFQELINRFFPGNN